MTAKRDDQGWALGQLTVLALLGGFLWWRDDRPRVACPPYAETVEVLRATCAPGAPVHVTVQDTGDAWGWTHWDEEEGAFYVALDDDLVEPGLTTVLVHEWAHTLAWTSSRDHGRAWGVAFARCYRAAMGVE